MAINIREADINDVEKLSYIQYISWSDSYKDILPDTYLKNLTKETWIQSMSNSLVEESMTSKVAIYNKEIVGSFFISNNSSVFVNSNRDHKVALKWDHYFSLSHFRVS